jgi:hypothetical protein
MSPKDRERCSLRAGPSSLNFKFHREIFAAQPHFLCVYHPAPPETYWRITISNLG